jgi:hypothetical protein
MSGIFWKAPYNFQLLINGRVSVRCGFIKCTKTGTRCSKYHKVTRSIPKGISVVLLSFCVTCATEHGGSSSSHSDRTRHPEKNHLWDYLPMTQLSCSQLIQAAAYEGFLHFAFENINSFWCSLTLQPVSSMIFVLFYHSDEDPSILNPVL